MDAQLKTTIEKLLNSDDVRSQEVGIRTLLHDDITIEDAYYFIEAFTREKDRDDSLNDSIHEVIDKIFPTIKEERINEL